MVVLVVRCTGLRNVQAAILVNVLSECATFPAEMQYLLRCGCEPCPVISLLDERKVLIQNKAMVNTSAVMLTSSTTSINTATVAVQNADERAMAMAGNETENYITAEGRFATSSEMVPELIEEQQKSDKEAAPTIRCTAVDKNDKIELAVTEMVAEEPGEDLSTVLEVENACVGRRLPSGLLFWLNIAAAACVLIGATVVLPAATKSVAFHMRRIDEATPRTAVNPAFSIKEVSYSATLG